MNRGAGASAQDFGIKDRDLMAADWSTRSDRVGLIIPGTDFAKAKEAI
jgi:hypothetical protein